MLPCRLIIDLPASGDWNMAVDEVLLDQAADEGIATLRFYQWSEPTLSLGYFQPYTERHAHAESTGCPVVRRHSGGGAILHDHELTYSLALPAGSHPVRDPHALYLSVHRSLRDHLVDLIDRRLEGRIDLCSAAIPPEEGEEPFLCFRRRAMGDLIVQLSGVGYPQTIDGRHKVAGSAQRKRRGAVLQHGSILLANSAAAPQLPGLKELTDQTIEAEYIAQSWAPALAEALGLAITRVGLDEDQKQRAWGIRETKFAQPAWTNRR